MLNLLESLILVSEKAANIARICRENEHLFALLIEQKHNDANPRFFQDFKTLADVLIQESIKYDISAKFPQLTDFIHGEENNTFNNLLGERITVSVMKSQDETAALLSKVCGGDTICADLLAQEVHRQISFREVEPLTDKNLPMWDDKYTNDLAIWIDPIDSTLQYIRGIEEESTLDGVPSAGLICATVLIGAYSRSTGEPKIGIINQPFHTNQSNGYKSKIYWGVSHESICKTSSLTHTTKDENSFIVAISSSEQQDVVTKLTNNGTKTIPLAGAGYKILNVILGNCDCFVLSKSSTYNWDTCGPHAILKSMGGGIIEFTKAVSHSTAAEMYQDLELNYVSEETKNSNGIIAYKDPQKLQKVLNILRTLN